MKTILSLAAAVFSLCSMAHAAPQGNNAPRAPKKIALLIASSELKYKVAPDLRGPVNDVQQMRQILVDRYGFTDGDVTTIGQAQATRAGIIAAIEQYLIREATPGDLLVLYYSGHGVQVPDQAPLDEVDGLDEAIVPYDANVKPDGEPDPKTVILDDTLGELIARFPSKHVVVLLDACHSGTGVRGGITPKRWITKKRSPGAEPPPAPAGADAIGGDLTGPTVLSAAAASEVAADSELLRPVGENDNPNVGAFTFALLDAISRDANKKLTYRQALGQITECLRRFGYKQTPQLEGSDLDLPLFSLAAAPTPVPDNGGKPIPLAISQAKVVSEGPSSMELERVGGGRFQIGSVYGLSNRGIARIIQTSDGGLKATGTVVGPRPASSLEGRILHQTAFPATQEPLRVAVTGKDTALVESVSAMVRPLAGVQVVPGTLHTPRNLDLEVSQSAGGITVAPYRNQTALPVLTKATAADLKPALVAALQNLEALELLLRLDNPNPSFGIDLKVNERDGGAMRIGDTVTFTVRPSADCYLYIVDVDPAGKVTVLFPNKIVPDNHLKAGKTYPMPLPDVYRFRLQGPAGAEVVKAIATTEPLTLPVLGDTPGDFSALTADALTVSKSLWNSLTAALRPDGDKEGKLISTSGWAASTVYLDIRPAAP